MSAQANIIAFDGAATPVTHTFLPISSAAQASNGELIAEWREGVVSLPVYAQISVTQQERKLPNGIYRVATTVKVPVMESVAGQNSAGYTAAPKVAYVNNVSVVGYFHERSTIADRRLARQLCINIGGGVATSVVPVTTGPVPELMDQLIIPS